MPVQLLSLSRELLEEIALNLESLDNYKLALTCRDLAGIVSGRPLYERVSVHLGGNSCERLYTRLEEVPELGQRIRHYHIESDWSLPPSRHISASLAVNLTLAFHLIRRMPNIKLLELPIFSQNGGDADLIAACLRRVTIAASLQQVHVYGWADRLSLQSILPLLAMPNLTGLHLLDFQLSEVQHWSPTPFTSILSFTLGEFFKPTVLPVGATQESAFRNIFQRFPNVRHLRLLDHCNADPGPILCLIPDNFPGLRTLNIENSFHDEGSIEAGGDWLASLPELESLTADGYSLGQTSLFYLSAKATYVDLRESRRSQTSLAYAIQKWTRDPAITQRRRVLMTRHNDTLTDSILVCPCLDISVFLRLD